MATVSGLGSWVARGVHKTVWTSMGNADNGSPQSEPNLPDKTVTVLGTNWGGATMVIQGSNDGSNWNTLQDVEGAALSFTVGAVIGPLAIQENPLYIRPSTSGGAATDLTVVIASHGGR